MAKKHPGDDGDWNLDSASPEPRTIRERVNTLLSVASPGQISEMKKEEEFLRSVRAFTTKRFTDRRAIPGRDKLIP